MSCTSLTYKAPDIWLIIISDYKRIDGSNYVSEGLRIIASSFTVAVVDYSHIITTRERVASIE